MSAMPPSLLALIERARHVLAWLRRLRRQPPADHSPMRVVSSRKVAHCVYEVTTESEKYERVTRNWLVLPEELMG